MSELPKIVRTRLAAQQSAQGHPDADLLTAFAEDALTGRERESIMAHLAACADCREVVSLIAPAEGPPLRAAVEQRQWFTYAVLRWAAIPATAAVVLGVVLLHNSFSRRPAPQPAVSATLHEPVANQTTNAEPHATESPAAVPAERAAMVPKRQRRAVTKSQPETAQARAFRPALRSDETKAKLEQNQPASSPTVNENVVIATAKPAPAPAPPPPVLSKSATTSTVNADSADRVSPSPALVPPPPPPPVQAAEANTPAAQAKKSMAKPPIARGAMAAAPVQQGAVVGGVVGSPRYTVSASTPVELRISPAGQVERRIDPSAPWQPVRIDDTATFRAVARIGNDIWAGGKAGVLYHSDNAGATWQRVAVPTTDDIVGLAFSNGRDGAIATASGARYLTHDAGANWEKAKE